MGEDCESSRRINFGGASSNQLLEGTQNSSQRKGGFGLLAISESNRAQGNSMSEPTCSASSWRSPEFDQLILDQTSKPISQISNKGNFFSVYLTDCEQVQHPERSSAMSSSIANQSSTRSVVSRRSPLPLSVGNAGCIARAISEPSSLTLSWILQHIESIFSGSGTCNTPFLSSILLRHISLSQIPRGIPNVIQRSFLPASGGGNSTSQLSPASTSSHNIELRNGSDMEHMRRQLLESALYMHRLADRLLDGSMSLMILTSGNEVNFRLVSEDIQEFSQLPLFYTTEMHDRYRDMRLDVDNMSYEELLALEDHMGYANTGLSEEEVLESLKHTKYFLFGEENAGKECCSICQEDYVEDDELGVLDCDHSFHSACIQQWLRSKNLCPICKSTGLSTTGLVLPQIHSL